MKKLFFLTLFLMSFCLNAVASDFSGTYQCHLNDKSDGSFDATLILTSVKEASFPKIGYASYNIKLNVADIAYPYVGVAAARGNELALYFEATGDKKDLNDRGVGIASVIVDKDDQGKDIVTIHKFYYEQSYKGKPNYGFEKCVKTEN